MRRNSSSNANLKGCLSGTSCKFKFGRAPCFVRASHRATRASDNIVSGKGLVLVLCFLHASSKSNFRGSKCSYKMRCSAAKQSMARGDCAFLRLGGQSPGEHNPPPSTKLRCFPMSSAMSGGPMPPNLLPNEGSKAARAESKGPTAGARGLRAATAGKVPTVPAHQRSHGHGSGHCGAPPTAADSAEPMAKAMDEERGLSMATEAPASVQASSSPFFFSGQVFLPWPGCRQRWQTCSYPQPPLHFPLLNLKQMRLPSSVLIFKVCFLTASLSPSLPPLPFPLPALSRLYQAQGPGASLGTEDIWSADIVSGRRKCKFKSSGDLQALTKASESDVSSPSRSSWYACFRTSCS